MKRDFDLIRRIMLDVESKPAGEIIARLQYDDVDILTLNHHIALLVEAGYLEGNVRPGYQLCVINRITWSGHDFLDAMRDDTIWAKAKESVLKPVGNVALDVFLEWLKWQARLKLGMPI